MRKTYEPNTVMVSVVIPTHNRCELLRRTIHTVFEQTCPRAAYEVIVVVDGSTDGTLEMLHQLHPSCRFSVLEQSNRGQAAARNVGLRAASGDLILFLDDDLLCEPTLVAEHLDAHRCGGDQLVLGAVYVSSVSPPTLATRLKRQLADMWFEKLSRDGPKFPLDATAAPNVSAKRKTLIAFSGFEEESFRHSHEDMEFGIRLWCAGVPTRFRRSAVAREVYTKNSTNFVHEDGAACGRSEVRLSRKHPCFRRHSQLASFAEGGLVKRSIRTLIAHVPLPLELLAGLPCRVAECLPESKPLERVGLRLLRARRSVAMLRSAVAEAGGWRSFRSEFGLLVPVLVYHHVGRYRQGIPSVMTISPGQFERQIRWLKRRGYVGIRCSDWLLWLRGEKALPDKPVLVTFEDAYADVAGHALPILKHYGFSATVFVVTDQIGGTSVWDEREGSATLNFMTAAQIRQWAADGIEFGAHTRTHADLLTLDEDELANEIEGSAQHLSELLDERVCSFAYPYGKYSEVVRKHAREVFDLAFTLDEGLNRLGTDPWLLRRITIRSNDTLFDLSFYVRLGFAPRSWSGDLGHGARPFARSRRRWRTAELPGA